MSNQEPSQELIRAADVRAWQPALTKWKLKQFRLAGLITVVQVRRGSKRKGRGSGAYYKKTELKKALGLNGVH